MNKGDPPAACRELFLTLHVCEGHMISQPFAGGCSCTCCSSKSNKMMKLFVSNANSSTMLSVKQKEFSIRLPR